MKIKPTYEELEERVEKAEKLAKKSVFSEKLTRTLFDISNAVNTTTDIDELYEHIYKSLNKLMGLPNFYIAVCTRQGNVQNSVSRFRFPDLSRRQRK
ncbi:MAG: hypothetical protein HUK40_16630 [Desulfobacter sp.]|nr:hypothetical protein [Desulfobacter sp.]